jgi:hypothetical protein
MGWGNSFDMLEHIDFLEKTSPPHEKILNNRKPTHDPYTNPNCHLYYECGCGAILDPQTKRFAELNNYASEKGWKIRFGDDSYIPYCVKCGHDID